MRSREKTLEDAHLLMAEVISAMESLESVNTDIFELRACGVPRHEASRAYSASCVLYDSMVKLIAELEEVDHE